MAHSRNNACAARVVVVIAAMSDLTGDVPCPHLRYLICMAARMARRVRRLLCAGVMTGQTHDPGFRDRRFLAVMTPDVPRMAAHRRFAVLDVMVTARTGRVMFDPRNLRLVMLLSAAMLGMTRDL